jgi:hypothetical protein
MKTDPSASKPETVAMSESSEGSSSEVNSPVNLAEAKEGKITGGDETMENFDLEGQLEDLTIYQDDNSDQSIDSWKTGLELSKDDNSIFSSHNSNPTIGIRYSPSQKITKKNSTTTTTQYLIQQI